jgi:hypothetical protein
MKRSAIVICLFAIAFPSLLPGQEAGIIITETVKTPPMFGYPAKTRQVRTWISGGRLRRDEGEKSRTILILPDAENAWLVNHRDSTVTPILPETLQGLSMIGIGMFGIASDSVTGKPVIPSGLFRRTGRTQTVNGWRAEEYRVEPGGPPPADQGASGTALWISSDSGLVIGVYLDILKKMMGPVYAEYVRLMDQFRELKGYPVLVQGHLMGMEIDQTLTAVEKSQIPDSAFEWPAAYKRKTRSGGP